MKKKLLLLRLVVLVTAMMCALGAAAVEAYACYTPSNTTLTFYYDNYRSSRTGTTYDLNTGSNYTGWEIGGVSVYVTKVVFDPSFANARPTTTYSWFYGMNNLQSITGLNYLNTSEVTNMGFMFGGCNQLTSLDVSNWNTSKVTTMNGLFYNCRGLTSLDLNSFNTSKVTDMDQMFDNCNNLRTIYVGNGWSTAAVTYSNYMFFGCTNLVGGQGTTYSPSNPTNKTYAHIDGGPSNPGYFTAPPEAYACYTESNTTLTFYYDTQRSSRPGTTYYLNTGSNYTGWDTDGTRSNVTKVVFDSSFAGARPTSTCDWFFDMQNLQTIQGIEYLNTSEVTNMNWMFMKCTKLTSLDVSHFNTSKVISMTQMFYGSSNLRTIYVSNGWSTAAVTTSENMFYNCTSLVGGKGTTYDANHIDKAYARIDGGPSSPGYFTDKNAPVAYACYTPSNTTLTFYYDNYRSYRPGTTYDLNEGNNWPGWMSDGTAASVTRVVFNSSFAGARPSSTQAWFADMANLQSVSGMQYLNTSEVTNMFYMFAYCGLPSLNLSYLNTSNVTSMEGMFLNSSFTSLDVSSFNTSNVVDMNEMFAYCYNLTSLDLSTFNTSNVTNMEGMFNESISLESINMSNWNTSNVTDMSYMFNECNALSSIDVSHFNTSKVTDMQSMFNYCTSLTSLDLRNFDTSNVTNMEGMFNNCQALESLNVSNWKTSNVTNMGNMFTSCSRLTSLDLGGFNTSKVTLMWYMFSGCSQLVTIYAGSGWSTAAVTDFYSDKMFLNCTKIRGGQGTTYDATHVNRLYARIDGGTSNPGYFTIAPVAYACYTSSNTTLTFYYDNQRSSRTGTTYDLNTGANDTGWENDGTNANVSRVVFDPSFANARPTTTYSWFYNMRNLQSITGMEYLNTSEVTNMGWMFTNCNKLTSLDVSHFNTSKVIYMNQLFSGCIGLTSLDLSSFNTSNVTIKMSSMFYNCYNLRTIYVGSGWSTAAVTSSTNMFFNCTSLVGGQGTTWNESNPTDKTYAHIDGGTSNPGYFTAKNASQRGDINGDGLVNVADVTALIQIILNSTPVDHAVADLNNDNNVNVADVTALIQIILNQ